MLVAGQFLAQYPLHNHADVSAGLLLCSVLRAVRVPQCVLKTCSLAAPVRAGHVPLPARGAELPRQRHRLVPREACGGQSRPVRRPRHPPRRRRREGQGGSEQAARGAPPLGLDAHIRLCRALSHKRRLRRGVRSHRSQLGADPRRCRGARRDQGATSCLSPRSPTAHRTSTAACSRP